MLYRNIVLLLGTMLLISCGPVRPYVGTPWQQKLLNEGPPGPAMFKQGWRDGCETGIAANANNLQKFFYKFKQDGNLAQNPVYYSGWKTAWVYCMRYTFNYLHTETISGDWGSKGIGSDKESVFKW